MTFTHVLKLLTALLIIVLQGYYYTWLQKVPEMPRNDNNTFYWLIFFYLLCKNIAGFLP